MASLICAPLFACPFLAAALPPLLASLFLWILLMALCDV
jgi:hypothetical protein